MPIERLDIVSNEEQIRPGEVYVTLRDLVASQFDAKGFSFLPKFAVQSILSGRHRSKMRGRGLDFEEVRHYVAGDDIRNIDWKVTARVGETYSKVFTEEKERPVFLITDQSSSMFFGTRVYFKSVIAARLAAITCWKVLGEGDRVGGVVFNDKKIEFVSPKRDRSSIQRYLNFVADQNQELNTEKIEASFESPLNEALKQSNEVVTHDYLVVVISDFNTADNTTLRQLIRLRKNNDIIVARISDPGETNLSPEKITLTDGLFQTRLEKDLKLKARFASERKANIEKLEAGFKKYGIPLLEFDTLEQPAKQLRSMLSDRSKPTKG